MRLINTISREIRQDWKNVSPYAKPYLDAMDDLHTIDQMYYADTAESVVLYFLANASTWRGDKAREIKAELKGLLK